MSMKVLAILIFFIMAIPNVMGQNSLPVNTKATTETIKLLQALRKISQKGQYLFGHQDDLAYGIGWNDSATASASRSDVQTVCGDFPALYGWELGGIETGAKTNLDGVPFNNITKYIQWAYKKGAVITISWHVRNPISGLSAWDITQGTVNSILPGHENHALYRSWLDKLAAFFNTLKGKNGKLIPVLFRPFHELTGDWFWWCKNTSSPEAFKTLWRFTVNYLQKEKKLDNILWVYNTADRFQTKEDFLQYYPGDDYADVLSFDQYQSDDSRTNNKFVKEVCAKLKLVAEIALQKNKPFALAETGYEAIPDANWWTQELAKAIGDQKIAYVLVWRNHGYHDQMKKMHYYAPYKGHPSAADFVKFYELPQTLFQRGVSKLKIYK